VSRSIFVVTKNDTLTSSTKIGTGPHYSSYPPNTYGFDFVNGGNINFHPYVYTGSDVTSSGIFTNLTLGYSFFNSDTNTLGGYINNPNNLLTTITTLDIQATPWYLGRRADGAGASTSHLCEILYYDRVLS
jgi:hypothetical protein